MSGMIQFEAGYAFRESYIPPRCRKPRVRVTHGTCMVEVPSVSYQEAPVAMRHKACHFPNVREYRWYKQALYAHARYGDYLSMAEGWLPMEELKCRLLREYVPAHEVKANETEAIQACQEWADRYLIVNGEEVWVRIGEPRYVIATFGLGHNHASTALMISNCYNENIRGDYYFNAMEAEKAVARCVEVAKARGDTNSVDNIRRSWKIEVLIPEAVRCNPAEEAGPGDPFINLLDEITKKSDSPSEAAALAFAAAGRRNGS